MPCGKEARWVNVYWKACVALALEARYGLAVNGGVGDCRGELAVGYVGMTSENEWGDESGVGEGVEETWERSEGLRVFALKKQGIH